MTASYFGHTPSAHGFSQNMNGEVTPYLKELANRVKETQDDDFSESELNWNILDRIIAYAASAEQHIVEQQIRIRELEDLSTTDELTGLNNRRALQNHMQKVLSSAKRYKEFGVLAFLDLDFFKEVNDEHGHDAGDKVLVELSNILTSNLRDTDYVARLAGDEFVFVLERADTTFGLQRAAEIRDIICNSEVKLKRGTVKLSASLGLAIYDENSTYAGLLKSADKAMYADKKYRR